MMGVDQGAWTRQSESLGGSAASGGNGGGRGVRCGFCLDTDEVFLAFEASLSSGMMYAGKSRSDLDVRRQEVIRNFRQGSQLQL